jgi:hypothetical protein
VQKLTFTLGARLQPILLLQVSTVDWVHTSLFIFQTVGLITLSICEAYYRVMRVNNGEQSYKTCLGIGGVYRAKSQSH